MGHKRGKETEPVRGRLYFLGWAHMPGAKLLPNLHSLFQGVSCLPTHAAAFNVQAVGDHETVANQTRIMVLNNGCFPITVVEAYLNDG